VNATLVFDTQWIVHTQNDWYKFLDLVYKGYQEYQTMSNLQNPMLPTSNYSLHYEKLSQLDIEKVCIKCTENDFNTIIKIETLNSKNNISQPYIFVNIVKFQMFLDQHLFFCSHTLFENISYYSSYVLICFLLSKFIKM